MPIVLNGTTGITNDSGYTGDGVSFADSTPANTLVITSGGNVGIGTSSPGGRLEVTGAADGDNVIRASANSANGLVILRPDGANGNALRWGGNGANANTMRFVSGGDAERARIDSSGNLLVGTTNTTTNQGTSRFKVQPNSDTAAFFAVDEFSTALCQKSTAITQNQILFVNTNGRVGAISTTGSATTYATSSDYRLKHDIAPMTGALAKVAALKPCTYKWNADDSAGEGFIAHELAEVCPSAVTGEKDAVDAEGNPQYQGIDTSFLVATLTAAIQEQQAIIESLTARVAALEGQA